MSDNIFGRIDKIEVSGPFEGKNGKPDFDRLTFTVNGSNFTKLTNVGAGTEFNEGDNVHIFFSSTKNGRFTNNNIIKIELSDKVTKKSESSESTTKPVAKSSFQSPSKNTSSVVTSKDISMEVSGLLQSIIVGGNFKLNEPGVLDVVETALRSALQLKRRVAKELETKGSI